MTKKEIEDLETGQVEGHVREVYVQLKLLEARVKVLEDKSLSS